MSGGWLGRTAILLLIALGTVMPANADGPGSELTLLPDDTFTSPDGQIRVEQYSKKKDEYDRVYQFWTFDQKHQNGALLNRDEDPDLAGYPAGFRFSRNSQWLVRMQKLGAGYHTLFLYRRTGDQFSSATRKPFGDMAWDYFFSQPVSRKMHRKSRIAIRSITCRYIWSRGWTIITPGWESIGLTAAISCLPFRSIHRVRTSRNPGSTAGAVSSIRKPGNSRFPPISPTTTPRRSSSPTGAADKPRKIGPLRPQAFLREWRQNAGIDGQNQYVAARNRPIGPADAHVRIGRRPEIQENSFESHRQFYSQGQHHRAGRPALRRPHRRKHPSRQGNSGQPDRNAPDRRWREDFGTLQDHRPGREGDRRGSQFQLPL